MFNPVAALQDETLTDQKDADYAALQPTYRLVTLLNLDDSGNLRGDYADVCGNKSCAESDDGTFLFGRDRVVRAGHGVLRARRQLYIQSLGFTDVNNEPQTFRADQFGRDNSFYDPKKDTMRVVGKGGVDDGEDIEVIWHEYGHATRTTRCGFGVTHDDELDRRGLRRLLGVR